MIGEPYLYKMMFFSTNYLSSVNGSVTFVQLKVSKNQIQMCEVQRCREQRRVQRLRLRLLLQNAKGHTCFNTNVHILENR